MLDWARCEWLFLDADAARAAESQARVASLRPSSTAKLETECGAQVPI